MKVLAKAAEYLSLGLSVAAIVVSLFAVKEARRVADANERLVCLSEGQLRPRLSVIDPSCTLGPDSIVIEFSLKNRGASPAVVMAVSVRTVTLADGSRFAFHIDSLKRAVLHPGDSQAVTFSGARRFTPTGATLEVDHETVAPEKFLFSLAYKTYDDPEMEFSESCRFRGLQWRKE